MPDSSFVSTIFQTTVRAARRLPRGESLAQGLWFGRYHQYLKRISGAVYSPKHQAVLSHVREHGYATIEGHWSRERCDRAIEALERCMRDYPVAVHRRDDERIFGLEHIMPEAREFNTDPIHIELSDEYLGFPNTVSFTLGNRVSSALGSPLGSGGDWHRDGFLPELKTMLYLSDVSEDNGPFSYYEGSHLPTTILRDMQKLGLGFQQHRIHRAVTRFSAGEERARRRVITAKAGTLLVFDPMGIHTGAPIRSGKRYALTNYLGASDRRPDEDALRHFAPIVVDGLQVLLSSGARVGLTDVAP